MVIPCTSVRAQDVPRVNFQTELKLTTNDGLVALRWHGDHDGLVYELQSAQEPGFLDPITEYEGTDQSSFQSGLPNGRYFFRIRARQLDSEIWGPWSDSVELICEHHSPRLAWTLFASGGLLFLLIVLFVGVNARSLDRFENNDD